MKFSSRRRKFLIATFGVGLLAMSGAGLYVGSGYSIRGWIHGVLRRRLPDVPIANAQIDKFVDDVLRHDKKTLRLKARLYMSFEPLLSPLIGRMKRFDGRIEQIERQIITSFLFDSNFFETNEAKSKEVIYYGRSERHCARANPFAQFLD